MTHIDEVDLLLFRADSEMSAIEQRKLLLEALGICSMNSKNKVFEILSDSIKEKIRTIDELIKEHTSRKD